MNKKNKYIQILLILILILISVIILLSIIATISYKNFINNKKTQTNKQIEMQKNIEEKLNVANTDFALTFLKMENNKKNMVYSPLSIAYALKMLDDGANGNTRTQIENIVGKMNLTKYNNIDNILSLANGIYIRDTYSNKIKEEYKNNLLDRYNAEIQYDSFKDASNINNWIERKTFGQVKNMLRDDIVADPYAEMFLINTLAIDMEWKEKFDEEDTMGDTFYLENGNTIHATTMNITTKSDDISYYQNKNCTALAMELQEYNNQQMEFILIMPNDNLSEYINQFSIDELENITNQLIPASKSDRKLEISLPKFSFDYDLNLRDDLKKLGITDAFNGELADFSNMGDTKGLYVDDAKHKVNIDFTEKGVKAAAVTVLDIRDTLGALEINEPLEIKINKPFVYFIRDKKTNEIWFVGTVYEPNNWEKDKEMYQAF